MDQETKDYGRLNVSNSSANSDIFEPESVNDAKMRTAVIEWLNSTLSNLNLPVNASDEQFRTLLADGTILCRLMNKLGHGPAIEYGNPHHSSEAASENVHKFLAAMDEMSLPHFNISDLEKGSMKIVLECLLTLKAHFTPNVAIGSPKCTSPRSWGIDSSRWKQFDEQSGTSDSLGEELSPRKFQRGLRSPMISEPTSAYTHHAGHKFHEVFQMKHGGGYSDLPASKISELMKSNSLDIAPTQSLLSMVNGILDESISRKNGEIPHRVACLMRKVVQEIERRISTQAEHLRTQNNLFKTREEKYQSRIRVLEALANGTSGESTEVINHFDHMKMMMSPFEQIKVDVTRTGNSKDSALQTDKTTLHEEKKTENQEVKRKMNEKDSTSAEIAALKQELENVRKAHKDHCLQLENDAKKAQDDLEKTLQEVENHLGESKRKVQQLEDKSRSKSQKWNKKEHIYKTFTEFQLGALKELRFASQSVRQELLKTQKSYTEDIGLLGTKVKVLQDAAESYEEAVSENRKLHNEIQELKGNIRVYCRIRPFLPGQKDKQTTIDYIGENGEIIVVNPSKPGKDSRRSFKFNKVYGPHATQ
nr:kinesin-like protein KIN-14C [Tanacetum cinerariifolium]